MAIDNCCQSNHPGPFLIPKAMSSVDDENSSTSTSSSSMTIVRPVLRPMLRPSAFSSQLFSKAPAAEEEPGAGAPAEQADEGRALSQVAESKLQVAEAKEQEDTKKKEEEKPAGDPHSHPLALLTKSNGLAKSNPFTANQVTALSSSSGFVFGQNVRDRVTGNVEDEANGTAGGGRGGGGGGGAGSGSGESNGDLTFSAATAENDQNMAEGAVGGAAGTSEEGGSGKSLSDVAREYEENKNARKRKFEEVETFTGEEDEINVLDVTCKLYTFAQVYEERGRGSLRLNDPKKSAESVVASPRLVFRAAGSLRVLLNTKIWDGMIAEPASAKSLRLTAIDQTGQVKVYLVMARPSDIQTLTMALKLRISAEKSRVAKRVSGGRATINGGEANDLKKEEEKKSSVTPDLIANTDEAVDLDEEKEEEDADRDCLIVEIPVPKRRAMMEPEVDGTEEVKDPPPPPPAQDTEIAD